MGLLEDFTNKMTLNFKNTGDIIYLIGETKDDISSSEYLQFIHKVKHSPAPYFDLETEISVQNGIKNLIKKKLIESAHDVSEGGLFVALMESAMPENLGFDILTEGGIRHDAALFGESQSRVVVSVNLDKATYFEAFMNEKNIKWVQLGTVTSNEILVDDESWGDMGTWKTVYDDTLGETMNQN